ncbi:MAG: 2-dehydropantoate 2-reductase [Nevskiaceae bacterium]|nr:MAG: 2-dehydropantoate 2-reductase [Nevskiaceae bacterium]TBR74841.1 MAG: 2-dehydropantoate 2-reductase [Nevskiaceae bacterium]
MKILILGAGATGGYFGARLVQASRDVTFLLRPARADLVREHGLALHSAHGDALLHPSVVTDAAEVPNADFVFLTCKAYDLASAVDAIAPAVGPHTTVVPFLNGMAHYDVLDARFGAARVLGGFCAVHATLDVDGSIRQWGRVHRIRFGERDGSPSRRVRALEAAFAETNCDWAASSDILGESWGKWIMLASMAGVLCLMRADLATVMAAPHGREIYDAAVEECCAVARATGHAPDPRVLDGIHRMCENATRDTTASMLRDLRAGHRVEADHTIGDMVRRATGFGIATPVLSAAYCHLKCYEALRDTG